MPQIRSYYGAVQYSVTVLNTVLRRFYLNYLAYAYALANACTIGYTCRLASSPGHSQLFNVAREDARKERSSRAMLNS